jgi:hypothetical protein
MSVTKNFYKDGPPPAGGTWATAARSPEGRYGVAIGCGSLQIGFVPEDDIDRFVRGGAYLDEAEWMVLILDAQKTLPGFKAGFKHADQAPNN